MRRLVVCADGTWKTEDDSGVTNVVKLKNAIDPSPPGGAPQLVFYDPGVGVGSWWNRLVGGAFGHGLSQNVLDCYCFLIENFQPGDQLFFFGFSRGAYTVRSLAGLVRKCGILRPEHAHRTREAYDFYRDRHPSSHPAEGRAQDFRARYSHETRIRCVGVWDTVGSLGVPTGGPVGWLTRRRHGFHDVRLSSHVENGFHALAIDERRKPFAPTLWQVRESDASRRDRRQRIEQRWFPGVHSNVGGGYPDCGLSDLTLLWMMDRAEQCGLEFRADCREGLKCDCGGELYDSMTRIYRVFGSYVRSIGAAALDPETKERVLTFEDVDDSALERHARQLVPPYEPPNFLSYWGRNPDRWPEHQPSKQPAATRR